MFRSVPLFAAAVAVAVFGAIGCKGTMAGSKIAGDAAPALLIGPEAGAQAAPPVELPAKESARLQLRAAQEFERNFEKSGQDADLQNAIRLYEQARTSDTGTAKQAGRRLAALYDKAGDFSKSAAEYETLLKASPKDADLLNDLGYSHYCRGDWANAEAALLRAVQFDANHKRAWTNLGLAQAQLGKWDDSFASFCKAVRPAEARCNLAFVLAAQGKTEEAKLQYKEALTLDPGLRVAQAGLSRLENPQPPERPGTGGPAGQLVERLGMNGVGDRPSSKRPFDPVEAAAKVRSVAELEAELKKESAGTPVVLPASEVNTVKPQ